MLAIYFQIAQGVKALCTTAATSCKYEIIKNKKRQEKKWNNLLGNLSQLLFNEGVHQWQGGEESQRFPFPSQAGISEAPRYLRKRPGADSRDLGLRSASVCPYAATQLTTCTVSCLSLLATSSSCNPSFRSEGG